jgi:hypothetical protein
MDDVPFGGESMSSSPPIDTFQSMWKSVGGYEGLVDGDDDEDISNSNTSKKSSE